MANEKAIDYDATTGELVERELTEEETAELKKFQVDAKKFNDSIEAKVSAKESAIAKLAKLGLTEEEIASL
jgi:DNA-binding NarL/FixJ family response regulator